MDQDWGVTDFGETKAKLLLNAKNCPNDIDELEDNVASEKPHQYYS